jgi:hypothetical protein
MTTGKKLVRCAIYTRKSTEHNLDLEFNSLDAQREARWDGTRDQIGKVFLCASCIAASCSGHRGRTDIRRKPSRRSKSPIDRSAI